jgi:hypothetical protein
MKKSSDTGEAVALGCLAALGGLLLLPLLYIGIVILGFLIGAFAGWLLMAIVPWFGAWIVSGVALLGIHITLTDLPLFVATLGFVAGFFKSHSSSK